PHIDPLSLHDALPISMPRPLVIEMGGKNPALIMRTADLEKATEGVMRSAFSAQGQKCSACSRVYVNNSVRDEFVRLLVEKTKKIDRKSTRLNSSHRTI